MANSSTKIGKDVIESLTLGMYEDARFVFREYVQNSADQIDKAVETGLLSGWRDGRIEIDIDTKRRSITIYDNATGIKADEVANTLKNIAQSNKDRTRNKGFRGIGRLGGLAYCESLTFETSYNGETRASRLTWDATKLKSIINNRESKEEASEVIDAVTHFEQLSEQKGAHFFRVILKGVSNDTLLDKQKVYSYLSMVAPVPYNKGFVYKSKIYEKAKKLENNIDEYLIFVNGDQLFKPYTTSIYQGDTTNKSRFDEIHDVVFYDIHTSKEQLLAWGWYSISKLEKVMPAVNTARGIRLRKGNIQIGMEDALTKLFKEPRGTKYFFGEIHVLSPALIPNARRDYFLENDSLKLLEKALMLQFSELHKLYYFSSKIRNEKKKIDALFDFKGKYEEKSNSGFTDLKEELKYKEEFATKKERAEVAQQTLARVKARTSADDTQMAQRKVLEKVLGVAEPEVETITLPEDTGRPKFITDSISSLSRKEKKLVSRIFGVIDNALPKDLANIVKEKIKEELQ